MNIYEQDGNGNYLNMGVIHCNICNDFIPNHSNEDETTHICDKCQDKIDLDDKYHNESYNLSLFEPSRMKFIDIYK